MLYSIPKHKLLTSYNWTL